MSEFNWVARGRHVTRSVSPCRILSLSTSDGSKNLLPPLICPPAIPCSNPRHFCDEPRGPTMISPLRVGPPTRRGGSSPGCASLIFDREVLRAPTCCADSSRTVTPIIRAPILLCPSARHTPHAIIGSCAALLFQKAYGTYNVGTDPSLRTARRSP